MLIPTLPGWKVETVGDDIAWMKFGDDGRLYAINPEDGLLRRGARHRREDEPQRDQDDPQELDLHQLRAHRRRRRVVGGHDARASPRTSIDWHGNDWTPDSDAPAAHPNARFTDAGGAVPVDRPRVGGPGRRADRRVPVRRPPRDRRPARPRGVRLGARRVPRRDDGLGDHGGPGRRGRRAALRPLRDAAVLRLQHGRVLPALARHRAARAATSSRGSSTSTGSARTRAGVPVARLRREQPRAGVGLPPARGQGATRPRRRSGSCRPRASSTPTGLDLDPETLKELLAVDEDGVRAELDQVREHLGKFGDSLPCAVREQLTAAGAEARRLASAGRRPSPPAGATPRPAR